MRGLLPFAVLIVVAGCGGSRDAESPPPPRPWILLVTLDTTRADAIGPGAAASTPAFNGLAARGRVFRQAYATVPETLPSHLSLMTGLYPAGHGVHENGRTVPAATPLLAERLRQHGYRTAAFVSSFVLASRFGLARGFEIYDDQLAADAVERSSAVTAARAIEHLRAAGPEPQLAWVHFFDPHTPYDPPARYRDRHPDNPYLGEIEAMDAAARSGRRGVRGAGVPAQRIRRDRGRRRSRRRARRPRRAAARLPGLRHHHACAARRDRPWRQPPAPPTRRSAAGMSFTPSSTGQASTRRAACGRDRRPTSCWAKP